MFSETLVRRLDAWNERAKLFSASATATVSAIATFSANAIATVTIAAATVTIATVTIGTATATITKTYIRYSSFCESSCAAAALTLIRFARTSAGRVARERGA